LRIWRRYTSRMGGSMKRDINHMVIDFLEMYLSQSVSLKSLDKIAKDLLKKLIALQAIREKLKEEE